MHLTGIQASAYTKISLWLHVSFSPLLGESGSCPMERHLPVFSENPTIYICLHLVTWIREQKQDERTSLKTTSRIALHYLFQQQIFPASLLSRKGLLVSSPFFMWGWGLYLKFVTTQFNCHKKKLKINIFSYLPYKDVSDSPFYQGQQRQQWQAKESGQHGEATLSCKANLRS